MGDVASMTIGVRGHTDHYEKAMSRAGYIARLTAQQISKEFGHKFDEMNRKAEQSGQHMIGVFNKLKGLAAGALGALGVVSVGEILKHADEYQQLEVRIRNAVGSAEDFKKVNSELYTIAQRNGVAFTSTAETFTSFMRAAKHFGATSDDVTKVTNAVQQLGVISGAAGASMEQALNQFAQALGSGVLQGDELKSILENMPALADTIAKGLGVATGELRKMGAEGKLLASDVFAAIEKQTAEIEKDFQRMPQSMSQAFTTLQNSVTANIGELDKTLGATKNIASSLKEWTKFIDDAKNALSRFGSEQVRVGGALVERSKLFQAFTAEGVERYKGRNMADPFQSPIFDMDFAQAVHARALAMKNKELRAQRGAQKSESIHRAAAGDDKAVKAAEKQANHYKDLIRHLEQANEETRLMLAGEEERLVTTKALADAQDKVGRALSEQEKSRVIQLSIEKNRLEWSKKAFEEEQRAAKALADKYKGAGVEQIVEHEKLRIAQGEKQIQIDGDLLEMQAKRQAQSEQMIRQMERQNQYQALINQGKEKEAEWLQITDQLADQANQKTAEYEARARKALNEKYEQIAVAKQQADLIQQAQTALSNHVERNTQLAHSLSNALGNAFENAIIRGQGFGSVLRGLAVDLERLILKITVLDPLTKLITGGTSGGGLFSAVTNLFHKKTSSGPSPITSIHSGFNSAGQTVPVVPGFASGGNVPAGEAVVVGEEGPELIKPRASSTVVPNRGLFAQPEVKVIINNHTDAKASVEQRSDGKGGIEQIVNIVKEEVAQDIRRGGNVGRAIGDTYGARRSTIAR